MKLAERLKLLGSLLIAHSLGRYGGHSTAMSVGKARHRHSKQYRYIPTNCFGDMVHFVDRVDGQEQGPDYSARAIFSSEIPGAWLPPQVP